MPNCIELSKKVEDKIYEAYTSKKDVIIGI